VSVAVDVAGLAVGWTGCAALEAERSEGGLHQTGEIVVVFGMEWKHDWECARAAASAPS
jgi:hypothetical protein